MSRDADLIAEYELQKHPEGGWFSECYTSEDQAGGRAFTGSIYFLLRSGEISHFHQIDCDEIWYYHEGSGMRITVITDTGREEYRLGNNLDKDQRVMVVIPKGAIFAAENMDDDGYTFVSCMTTPKFTYDGFRLVYANELRENHPGLPEEIYNLAYKKELDEGEYDRQH